MILQLSFEEINRFLQHDVKTMSIVLSSANTQTLNARISKWFFSKDIQLSVDRIVGNDIYLTLQAGTLVNGLVRGAIACFKKLLPTFVKQVYETSFVVQLDQIEPAKPVLAYLAPQRIEMSPEGLVIEVLVK